MKKILTLKKETVEILDKNSMVKLVGGGTELPDQTWTCSEGFHCTYTVTSYYYDCPNSMVCSDWNGDCDDNDDGYDDTWECGEDAEEEEDTGMC